MKAAEKEAAPIAPIAVEDNPEAPATEAAAAAFV
jgi:hypothetical protein